MEALYQLSYSPEGNLDLTKSATGVTHDSLSLMAGGRWRRGLGSNEWDHHNFKSGPQA